MSWLFSPRTGLYPTLRRFGAGAYLVASVLASQPALAAKKPTTAVLPLAHHAVEAGRLCAAGALIQAREHLQTFHEGVAARVGSEHSAAQIAALSLSQVVAALGVASDPAQSSSETAAKPTSSRVVGLSAETLDALKALRSCSKVKRKTWDDPLVLATLLAGGEGGFEANFQAAQSLAKKGQYGAAAVSAERAHLLALGQSRPARRLEAARTVALLRLQVGDFEGAAVSARNAGAIAQAQGDSFTRVAMARLLAQVHYLDEANEVLNAIEGEGNVAPGLSAELLEARGDVSLKLGAPGRAIRVLNSALVGHGEVFGGQHVATAAVSQLLGEAHRMAGDIPSALVQLRSALSIRENVYGVNHPEVSRTHNALGVVLADLGDWPAADHEFGLALKTLTAELGDDHPEVVTVRANRVLVDWGREQSEVEAFHYAATLDALTLAYGEDHPVVSEARRNLARMQEQLGDPAAAEALLDMAMASQLRALGEGHPSLAQTLVARGTFFARGERLAEATEELDRAIVILRGHYGDEHPLVARALNERSRVATARGDNDVAWVDAVESARVFALHLERSFGVMPDRQRVLLASDAARAVGALLSSNRDAPRDVYIATLSQRDSVLRSIASSRARAREGANASGGFAKEEKALQELRARYVTAVLSESPDAGRRGRALARAIDAQESILTLARGSQRTLDPSEVLHRACINLPADAALVEFLAYDRVQPGDGVEPVPSYVAIVVRPRAERNRSADVDGCSVQRVELGDAQAIDAAADAFARAMRDQRSDAPKARRELSHKLLVPLTKVLRASERWLLIPDGSIWGVPFAALPDPVEPARYLVERVTTSTLTSIHELADYSPQPVDGPPERALLFGAPEFGVSKDGAGPVVLTRSGPCRLEPFEPLPGTLGELEEIRAFLPKAKIVLGSEATKRRLYDELGAKPSIVHLATHAYFAGAAGCPADGAASKKEFRSSKTPLIPNPLLLSGVVLAGANAPQQLGAGTVESEGSSSGILTSLEAAGLDLSSARLVVLSACDTGTGLHRRGQEVQGLRWGFRAAGAKSLLTSLWRSNDAVTRKMMRAFYASLRAPIDSQLASKQASDLFVGAASLRSAQLERIASERRLKQSKPLTWANFVFSGLY